MKKYIYSISACLLSMLCGCNDWLDVEPRSQIESNVLFETEEGYKQALNGVYIKLGQAELYGKNTSMYMPDMLAHLWSVPTKSQNLTLYSLANYDFTESNTENLLSSVFKSYYNAIAQLNDILDNLRKNQKVDFQYNNDKLIEGEALGLRAFLHLEVLRFWGIVPQKANAGSEAIPYVTEVTNDVAKLRSKTWGEVTAAIEEDLTDAENILKEYDPMVYADLDSLNDAGRAHLYVEKGTMPKDMWQMLRKGRFNYYAVLGTKARFYHWIGNKIDAVNYAKKVVDPKRMELCTESTLTSGSNAGLTFYHEHLFGVENVNLLDIVQDSYASADAIFTQEKENVDKVYESGVNSGDIRYANQRFWQEKTYASIVVNTFFKYIGNDNLSSDKRIPLIRLAEMYLILIEDLPLDKAKQYFSEFRVARGMTSSIEDSSMESDEARLARLEMEYRKEFYGEGQMFFFYKRHEYEKFTLPTAFTVPTNGYVLPKPKGLTNFE